MTTILLCDDNAPLSEQYAYDLRRLGDYEVLTAASGADALEALASDTIDCLVLDLEMPGMDGFGVLRAVRDRGIATPVIVYTGTGTFDRCVQAIKAGAYAFIDKADPVERVVREIENAIERRRILDEVAVLRRYADDESALLGASPAMRALKDAIARVAPVPSAVLITGESGSGKELVARDVHRLSAGAREPFIAVNCAALPEQLIESELFGHERGAFTGAATSRKGAFESAGRGTLFLDEIGELPAPAQAKLLRVLEERAVTRLGSSRPVSVPARVIAATNRDLDAEAREGRFRRDLLFRINVHMLRVPPLRDRLSDVPALVAHLVSRTCERFGMRQKRVSPEALDILMGYDWRLNNVRELRNAVERMIIAADGHSIGPEHVPSEVRDDGAAHPPQAGDARTFVQLKAEAERQIIVSALEKHDWHITRTAHDLGLADHASLLKIMRRHRISRD
ncbi:MAG TPA: sigma-54 dependent transcriptional regulator [Gemmatimonadaceae bacterium]|jgi:DNA-binding NtrC family response regulator